MGSGILDVVFTYFKIYGCYILFCPLIGKCIFLGLIVPGETILFLGSLHVNSRLFASNLSISQKT